MKICTPYMRSGLVYDDFTRAWGKPDAGTYVWKSTTALMNPKVTAARLEQQRLLDPIRFAREFEAEFTDDVAAAFPREWMDAAVRVGRYELPPNHNRRAVAAMDPSGGGADAFTFVVVIAEGDGDEQSAASKARFSRSA